MIKSFDKEKYLADQHEKLSEFSNKIKNTAENFTENPDTIADYIRFSSKFYNYSYNNTVAIYSQNSAATFVGSFLFFKNKGYAVKKGEAGLKILVPAPVKFFRLSPEDDWKAVSSANEKEKAAIKAGSADISQKMHFKLGTVFDISQTNCPKQDYPKLFDMGYASAPDDEKIEILKKFCSEKLNCPVYVDDLKSISLRGQYFPGLHRIEINSLLNSSQALSTLSHEMGHAILHNLNDCKESTTAQRELEADCISLLLQAKLGIDDSKNDVRTRHLSEHYRAYIKEATTNKEKPSFENVMQNVFERFNTVWPDMQPYFDESITKTASLSDEIKSNLPVSAEPAEEKNYNFARQFDKWDMQKSNFSFIVERTPEVLKKLGIKEQNIELDAVKIKKIMSEHPNMTPDIIRNIPKVLDEPIIIMKSLNSQSRITVFGELQDKAGAPVLIALELEPLSRKGNPLNVIKIASAYGKDNNPQLLINRSKMLYICPDIKKTQDWLLLNRLQLPLEQHNLGYIDSIAYSTNTVNNHYMQKNEKNSSLEDENMKLQINVKRSQQELLDGILENNPYKINKAVRDGADVNTEQVVFQRPLFVAVANNADEAVKALLENGAYPDVRDSNMKTPLSYAARLKDKKIQDTLLNYGADKELSGIENTDERKSNILNKSKGLSL